MSKRYFFTLAFSFFTSLTFLTPTPTKASLIYDTTLSVGQFYIDSASSLTTTTVSNIAGVGSAWTSFINTFSDALVPLFLQNTDTTLPTQTKTTNTYVRPTINTYTPPTPNTPPSPVVTRTIEHLVTTSGLTQAELDASLANLRSEMIALNNDTRTFAGNAAAHAAGGSVTNIISTGGTGGGTNILPLDNTFTGANTFNGNVTITGLCVSGDTRLRRRRKRRDGETEDSDEWEDVLLTDLNEGDEIASLDVETGKIVYKKVISIIETGVREILQITLADNKSIRTTEEHPYLLKGETIYTKDASWTKAGMIKVGDMIATPSSTGITWTTVSSIEKKPEQQVFDLQIEDTHNFIGNDIVAHNTLVADGSGITNINASNIATGTIDPARLGTGTADNTTYLRGDGTWATVAGGGLSASDLNNLNPIEVGFGNVAGGTNASALGYCSNASGVCSSAVGYCDTASGYNNVAIGYCNNASGSQNASAVGICNTASCYGASASGYNNSASGRYSSASGYANTASGFDSSASGYNNYASDCYSSAFGASNNASCCYTTALGYRNTASGSYATASGFYNCASGLASSAFGYRNIASEACTTAIGTYNTASGYESVAVGYFNNSSGPYGITFGQHATASGLVSLALGHYANSGGTAASSVGYQNTVSADYASAFGSNITNTTANSVEIGADNCDKLQISSAGVNWTGSGYICTNSGFTGNGIFSTVCLTNCRRIRLTSNI